MYFPASVRYGIPYETFRHLNPKKLMVYQDVYNEKMKEQIELMDFLAWRNGMYVVAAVQAALMPKKVKYPKEPLSKNTQHENLSGEEEFILWVAEFNMQHPDLPDA